MGEALQSAMLREPVWDEHEAIARAVEHGDVQLAERLMQQHSGHASTQLNAHAQAPKPPAARKRRPTPDNSVVLDSQAG